MISSKLQPKKPSMIDHSKIGIVNRSLVANKNKHGKIFEELNTLDQQSLNSIIQKVFPNRVPKMRYGQRNGCKPMTLSLDGPS